MNKSITTCHTSSVRSKHQTCSGRWTIICANGIFTALLENLALKHLLWVCYNSNRAVCSKFGSFASCLHQRGKARQHFFREENAGKSMIRVSYLWVTSVSDCKSYKNDSIYNKQTKPASSGVSEWQRQPGVRSVNCTNLCLAAHF